MMNLVGNALRGIRLAGTNLTEYLTNPATAAALGKKVAFDTAVGTAASQAIPRMLGQQPGVGIGRSALHAGLHSAISHPVAGGLEAMGMPQWASQATGQVVGAVGAQSLSQTITPEVTQQPMTHVTELMQLQQLEAAQEDQRVKNQIALAYARNYNPPSRIIHENPSQNLATVHAILNPKVGY